MCLMFFSWMPFIVTKVMKRVAAMTRLKVVSRSLFHKENWSSADEMAKEASQHDEYYAGTTI